MNPKTQNLLIRTATGIVFVAVVLAAMLMGRGTYTALLLVIAYCCTAEFLRLARSRTQKWLGTLYIVLCAIAMWFFPLIGGGMSGEGYHWSDCILLAVESGGWNPGIAPAFALIVWANDVFAYLVGITLGRHKMCPRISPHKSWEGFAGGIVGATVAAAFVGRFWIGGDEWRLWIPFGLFVALTAVGGDLTESWFKRGAGVKDSGNMLPGHGGLLDRFDAMLGAVPAAFLFLLITYLTK